MENQTVRLGKKEKNALARIVGLIAELSNLQLSDEFYDFELDSRHGFLVVKKWKFLPTKEGDELDIVAKLIWKPGVWAEMLGYTPLKGIQKWLEAELKVHAEANLDIGEE